MKSQAHIISKDFVARDCPPYGCVLWGGVSQRQV